MLHSKVDKSIQIVIFIKVFTYNKKLIFHGKQDATKLDTKNDHDDQRKLKKKSLKLTKQKDQKDQKSII